MTLLQIQNKSQKEQSINQKIMYGTVCEDDSQSSDVQDDIVPALITDILEQRLASLHISVGPLDVHHAPDVIFIVKETKKAPGEATRVLAHSDILKTRCDHFKELINESTSKIKGEEKENEVNGPSFKRKTVDFDYKNNLEVTGESTNKGRIYRSYLKKYEGPENKDEICKANIEGIGMPMNKSLCMGNIEETVESAIKDRISDNNVKSGKEHRQTLWEHASESIPQSGSGHRQTLLEHASESFPKGDANLRNSQIQDLIKVPQMENATGAGSSEDCIHAIVKADTLQMDKANETTTKYLIIEKTTWTTPILYAILEWIYTGCCHVQVEDLASVYDAAYNMIFTSLTGAIRCYSVIEYIRLAINNEKHQMPLLKLCTTADCPSELTSLRSVCEALTALWHSSPYVPFCILFHSAKLPYRLDEFLPEGYYTLGDHPVCCLRGSIDNEPITYVTFTRHKPQRTSKHRRKRPEPAQMRHLQWRMLDFGNNPPRCCSVFMTYAAQLCFDNAIKTGHYVRPVEAESFGLRVITGANVSKILKAALTSAIPQGLEVKEERGSGYYIKGPSYCFSIVISGDPLAVLDGAKVIPEDVVARAALRIRKPSEKTFRKFLPAIVTFGVDLEANTLYILKPLSDIIDILEFAMGLSCKAFVPFTVKRQMIELVEPTNPF